MPDEIVLIEELQKVIGTISYEGCLIEAKPDGYYVGGKSRGATIADAKAFIEQRFERLKNSFTEPVDTERHHFNEKGLLCH